MHHNYIQQAAYQSSVSGTKLLERSIPLQAEITNLQTLQQNRTDVVITYTVHEAIAKRGFKSDKKFYKNFDFHNMTVHALLCISYNQYWLTISLKWYFINATLGRGRYKVYNNISEEDIHNLVNIGITISVLISQRDSDWHEPLHWYFTRSCSTSSNNSQLQSATLSNINIAPFIQKKSLLPLEYRNWRKLLTLFPLNLKHMMNLTSEASISGFLVSNIKLGKTQ